MTMRCAAIIISDMLSSHTGDSRLSTSDTNPRQNQATRRYGPS
jgi:hypothetical protein